MTAAAEALRGELLVRRERLSAFLPSLAPPARSGADAVAADLVGLLARVDVVLERLDAGSFGICTVCQDGIETDHLASHPLATICLGCLTPEQSRALERDLEAASRVQAALLPERQFRREGWEGAFVYEPAGAVSGDYFDLVPTDGSGWPLLLLFGDVSGKGVAASLLQANLRALFRALAAPDLPLAELLARVNRLFFEATAPNAYATLVAARLDADGGVELANAGHPAPLVSRGGRVAPLEAAGLPLGLFNQAGFATHRFHLGAGETLLLYTDGLTEATDPEGEEFGRERAGRAFARAADRPLPELLATFREDLASFLLGSPRGDDLTVAALRRLA